MKREGEIAMLFSELEDSQIECVVGGASQSQGTAAVGTTVNVFAVGDYATTVSNTIARVIDLPFNYKIGFTFGSGVGIAVTHGN